MGYYSDKLDTLAELFGSTDIELSPAELRVGAHTYPIIDDVIVVVDPARYTPLVRARLGTDTAGTAGAETFAADIQSTFGREWERYGQVLPEYEPVFRRYFRLVAPDSLSESRVCDLGCGSGRWASFAARHCREIVLVDFSDAIFTARKNLASDDNALFFMGDILELPFVEDFADLIYCLGVLHHLPTPCLDEVRNLRRFAPRLLLYLYYNLDNRPAHYRALLRLVTLIRRATHRIRSERVRAALVTAVTYTVYLPLIRLGAFMERFGVGSHVPLYDAYKTYSIPAIAQNVYDRFFTRIEQRVSRAEIESLRDSFSSVTISPEIPYYVFLCDR